MDAYPKAAMERAMRVQDVEVADAEEDRFGPICVFPFANISNALPKCQPLPVAQSRVECGLISRNGHQGSSFDPLTFHLARIPHQGGALLDSEIACVDASGRPPFDDLPFRRREPRFFAFDLLHLNGKDCRRDCLARRKVALNTC